MSEILKRIVQLAGLLWICLAAIFAVRAIFRGIGFVLSIYVHFSEDFRFVEIYLDIWNSLVSLPIGTILTLGFIVWYVWQTRKLGKLGVTIFFLVLLFGLFIYLFENFEHFAQYLPSQYSADIFRMTLRRSFLKEYFIWRELPLFFQLLVIILLGISWYRVRAQRLGVSLLIGAVLFGVISNSFGHFLNASASSLFILMINLYFASGFIHIGWLMLKHPNPNDLDRSMLLDE